VLPPSGGGGHKAAGRWAGRRRRGRGGERLEGPAPDEGGGAGERAGEPAGEKHREGSGTSGRVGWWRGAVSGGCGGLEIWSRKGWPMAEGVCEVFGGLLLP